MGCAWAEPALQSSTTLVTSPRGESARQRPVFLEADSLSIRPDLDALAEGKVELRRAGTDLQADRARYDTPKDQVRATGSVVIRRDGNVYKGPVLELQLQRFEGFFLQPEFELGQFGSGGRAERLDFIDATRSVATRAIYSSCPRDGSADPDWLLQADKVTIDSEAQEGRAEGAVLRFLGTPILALPVLTFPLSDARKSGWLPPSIDLDSRSGFMVGMPYYWNIAPNRDATITPTVRTRRGFGAEAEFRYLEPADAGRVVVDLMPSDQIAGRTRHAWLAEHAGSGWGLRYSANVLRVSDDDYWKDFPHSVPRTTPRLLPADLKLDRELDTWIGPGLLYARIQQWQVLQTTDLGTAIVSPYQRSPQLGLRVTPKAGAGWQASIETEVNRFTRPDASASAALPTGWRLHALGQISRAWTAPGWWLTPKLAFNAASYALDQSADGLRSNPGRVVPTLSVDAGMVFERNVRWFGQDRRQTLEPRLLYVNTPYRNQLSLPNFDSAERDFNLISLFSENAFTGVDRVSDSHQLTLGVSSRLFDAATGTQTLRLALGQRVLFRDQRITSDGVPSTQKLSDVLLEGSTGLIPAWQLDAAMQYNPDSRRVVRSILNARYAPAPFHSISAGYNFSRGSSEQVQVGWQWPVYRGDAKPVGAASGCGGTLFGVGRINYSLRDSRITDSILGLEYDARCWVGRVVAQRLSTGPSEATTRLSIQIEFVGLSRLAAGFNSANVLKDNVPGYQLLRDTRHPSNTGADFDDRP
ncbi:MAG: LPS-assembly protein LptD [Ideonella sp.]|nr:LPS-assembly protein LptD [Ideonella sp.]